MDNLKRIILADDHNIVRAGLRELIEKLGPFRISCEFDNGIDLLEALEKGEKADLILMDLAMPGINGDKVMQKLKASGIEIPVLILTTYADENKQVELFRLGVRGFLLKSATAAEMKIALEDIFDRGYHHNAHLILALRTSDEKKLQSNGDKILQQLNAKEIEFLSLVCNENEFTYEQIAAQMNVHRRTVDYYRESVSQKFGVKSKTGLVLIALRNNLFMGNKITEQKT